MTNQENELFFLFCPLEAGRVYSQLATDKILQHPFVITYTELRA